MRHFLWLVLCAVISGCVAKHETAFRDVVEPGIGQNWRVTAVDVVVPRSLSVSEEKRFAPKADIVWREEPLGDRYEQVERILREGVTRGVRGLRGWRDVRVKVRLREFHALSERARKHLNFSGVHNITFEIRVYDQGTGIEMSKGDVVRADLPAFVGRKARAAEARGQTQRVRIVDHIAKVTASWLGTGSDPRNSFVKFGL